MGDDGEMDGGGSESGGGFEDDRRVSRELDLDGVEDEEGSGGGEDEGENGGQGECGASFVVDLDSGGEGEDVTAAPHAAAPSRGLHRGSAFMGGDGGGGTPPAHSPDRAQDESVLVSTDNVRAHDSPADPLTTLKDAIVSAEGEARGEGAGGGEGGSGGGGEAGGGGGGAASSSEFVAVPVMDTWESADVTLDQDRLNSIRGVNGSRGECRAWAVIKGGG